MSTSMLSTSHRGLHTAARGMRRVALACTLLAAGAGGLAGAGAAWADISVTKPVGQLFKSNGSALSPAGERWLRAQVAQTARQPDQMVVVQVPGATPALQRQRADNIRQRLAAMGVAPRHVYIEVTSAQAARLAGL